MAIKNEVKDYLDKNGVSYEVISHPQVFSTIDEARALGVNADETLKNLIVKVKEEEVFAIIPGGHRLDTSKLRHAVNSKHARLITEEEMAKDYSGYEIGAVPPLGELFGVKSYLDKQLIPHETVIFCGGTHSDCVKMKCQDFVNLVKPEIVDLVQEPAMEC